MGRDKLSEDKQWVEETLAGQAQSFEKLVRKYQDRLYTTMVHVTGNSHEAEEVVQDAMLQAYAKLNTFKGNSQFYTWLYRIAFNMSISRQRKKRPRVSLDQIQENAGIDPEDHREAPNQRIERSEQTQQIHDALNKLSEEYRSILVLREMEGCDYDTISGMLSIPVGTVRSRLHRARSTMREHLRQSLDEPA